MDSLDMAILLLNSRINKNMKTWRVVSFIGSKNHCIQQPELRMCWSFPPFSILRLFEHLAMAVFSFWVAAPLTWVAGMKVRSEVMIRRRQKISSAAGALSWLLLRVQFYIVLLLTPSHQFALFGFVL